ncbi:MAG: hypothetical protein WC205_09320 [Opitutaceae bacterium]|jgi:hypothetical protein
MPSVPSRLKTTRAGKSLAPVVDIFPQITVGHHDEARIAEEMRLLKTLGFERVYFVLCNPGYPMFANPALSLQPADIPGLDNHSARSVSALGDPNAVYARQCRLHGMEAFAILKPYEGGGGATVPHGAKLPCDMHREPDVGGDRIGFDDLLSRRPDLRVQRKPVEHYDRLMQEPVERITARFCIGPIAGVNDKVSASIEASAPVRVHLFTSEDNGAYHRHEGLFSVHETRSDENVTDANGVPVFPTTAPCRIFTLEGFSFPPAVRYFALVIECETRLHTIPQSMLALHGPSGRLPATLSVHIRNGGNPLQSALSPSERIWGMEKLPSGEDKSAEKAIARLTQWGFEYEWYGAGFWGPGWQSGCVYGLARGVLRHMKGTPCEAYPEVRAYWLDWVDQAIAQGFDGVDLRLQNHSGMVSDYIHYGYNPPIVEAYREKHGVDILRDEADPLKIMAIRGDYFTTFVEQAAAKLRHADRKLQIHLRHCHGQPKASTEFNELGFWAMPKIWLEQWRHLVDLADEITLKDYHFNRYDASRAATIKDYAHRQGKRVWVHCYISQGRELNPAFFESVEQDDKVGGVLLYEVAHTEKVDANFGLIEQHGPVGFHEPNVAALREIMGLCAFTSGSA